MLRRIVYFRVIDLAVLLLCVVAILTLGSSLLLAQIPDPMAQEEHLKALDGRITDIQADRIMRHNEALAIRAEMDQNIKNATERISRDEGIGIGLFSAIGILQGIGLLRKALPMAP